MLLLVPLFLLAHPAAAPPPQAWAGAKQPDLDTSPLAGTRWRLTHLGDTDVHVPDAPREPHLVFEADGTLIGADGCNALRGSYEAAGNRLTIRTPLMGTLMNCTLPDRLDRRFREALDRTVTWRVTATSLSLLDDAGAEVARFEAVLR